MSTLRSQLEKNGYIIIENIEDADIVIVNTCAVTSFTETKTRKLLLGISSSAPAARILVTGCLAQQKPEELKELPNVQWIVGNLFKNDIVDIINKENGVFHSSLDNVSSESLSLDNVTVVPLENDADGFSRTRFPVKIQEGCNFRCSYCIVPSLRGASRSASGDSIVAVCKKAIDAGYKELVLTGTHIGQFGDSNTESLLDLLNKMVVLDGDFRIRLTSLDPRDINDELLQIIGGHPKICDHLHVSLQSLSGPVLKGMHRPYVNLETLIQKIINFRNTFPYAGLGTDLIVGFPGEKDDHFNETLENVKRIQFSYAHIFRYSIRPQTIAATLPEQVPEIEKTRRSDILRAVIDDSRKKFLQNSKGILKRIIVESENPLRGLTSNYIHVEVQNTECRRNTWLNISVISDNPGRYCLAQPVV
jgi:threonylcarbamoyladenosine tRNA methylthiotransferase MtaB